jgi:GH25 family lysozyme M1 (1,4-beta-N-acetylmuramidase)
MSKRLAAFCAALLAAVLLAACGSTKTVTKTTPAPTPAPAITPKPGAVPPPAHQSAPTCDRSEQHEIEKGKGSLGDCTPEPTTSASSGTVAGTAVSLVQTIASNGVGQTGPDVSNNDPFYNWQPVKAHGHPFGYLKLNQGVRFEDRTAAGMARAARAAGVIPGGYDFLEVCRTNSGAEAHLFVSRLKAIGLSAHSLVPIGDAEWPLNAPCSAPAARAWLNSWASVVHSSTGRWPGFYSGAWWANPNLGCWRPPGGGKRWISGYTFRRNLVIPCGWGGVDLWQFTDSGFNGVSSVDMSVLEVPLAAFTGSTAPSKAQLRAQLWHLYRVRSAENSHVAVLSALLTKHGCRPPHHAHPASYHRRACPTWKAEGDAVHRELHRLAAQITSIHGKGVR